MRCSKKMLKIQMCWKFDSYFFENLKVIENIDAIEISLIRTKVKNSFG